MGLGFSFGEAQPSLQRYFDNTSLLFASYLCVSLCRKLEKRGSNRWETIGGRMRQGGGQKTEGRQGTGTRSYTVIFLDSYTFPGFAPGCY